MAVMTPCANEGMGSDTWSWDWNALTNREVGSTICLDSWRTSCLAAEFSHEHARVIVTRNGAKFFYNTITQQLILLGSRWPEIAFAININCALNNTCIIDGANLVLSAGWTPLSSQFALKNTVSPNLPPLKKGLIHSSVSEKAGTPHCHQEEALRPFHTP